MHFLISYRTFYYAIYPLVNNTILFFPNFDGMYYETKWFS